MFILSQIEHAPLARALTRAAYAAGARYVDVNYRDQHVRKAMIELGPDEALTYTPDWLKERAEALAGAAMIATATTTEPGQNSALYCSNFSDGRAGEDAGAAAAGSGLDCA